MNAFSQIAGRAGDPNDLDGTSNKGPTCGLYTGAGSTSIVVEMASAPGTQITFANPPAGQVLPIAISKYVSGPTGAVALYPYV